MNWNDVLNLVTNMERLGGFTVIAENESIKDIVMLNSNVNVLQNEVGKLWEVKVEKTDYVDVNNNLDYLVKVRINNRVGDIVSYIEVVGLDYLSSRNLDYLKENKEEFNRFIKVRRVNKGDILKNLEKFVNN